MDEGRLNGGVRADQSISFQLMQKKFLQVVKMIAADPAVEHMGGFASGTSNANVFVTLKPPGVPAAPPPTM